jgi:hypothetical protein
LLSLNDDENAFHFINTLKNAIKCGFYLLFFRLISTPAVRSNVLNGAVDRESTTENFFFVGGDVGISGFSGDAWDWDGRRKEIIVEGTLSGGFKRGGKSIGLTIFDIFGEFSDFFEVVFVGDRFSLAGGDEFVEEGGHLFVVGGVAEAFFDDFTANVIFNGFGNGGVIAFDAVGKGLKGFFDADFGDEFEEGNVVEGGDFSAS